MRYIFYCLLPRDNEHIGTRIIITTIYFRTPVAARVQHHDDVQLFTPEMISHIHDIYT